MKRSGTLGLAACFAIAMLIPQAWAGGARLETGGYYDSLFSAGGRPVGAFAGSSTAPGVTAGGVTARLSGKPAAEQYLFIQGDVGEVNLGLGRHAPYSMQFTAPYSGAGLMRSPALDAIPRGGQRAASYVLLSGEAYRLGYFTPRFAGMGGLSPSLNGPVAAPPEQPTRLSLGRLGESYETYEIGASYVARFDTLELALSAEHQGARSERSLTADAAEWTVGFGMSYAGFKIGGAYYEAEDLLLDSPALPAVKERGYSFGLGYGGHDWWIGTGVSRLTQRADHSGTSRSATTAYRVGGEYRIGPGMMIFSDVLLYNTKANGSGAAAPSVDDSRAIFFGVDLNF